MVPSIARWPLVALLVIGAGATINTGNYRLPGNVLPKTYELKVVPYLEPGDFKYEGSVAITVSAVGAWRNITLHAHHNLTVNAPEVTEVGSNKALGVTKSVRDVENDFLTLILDSDLENGKEYVIKLTFAGVLQKDLYGFYLSSYTSNGAIKYMATTHFEATYARKAFPCFDEPEYRANFSISLAREQNQISLSNMPLQSTSQPNSTIGGRVWDSFLETPKIPTYLVAYIVGELQEIKTSSDRIKVYVPSDVQVQDAAIAADLAPKIIDYLEQYTGIPCPPPKLDLVAVPDFPIGAMENWGLVTFKENRMLSSEASKSDKAFAVARIVAHELAHLWFGDYVTVEWWSYGWIKEGLAEMLQYYILDAVTNSEYNAVARLAVDETQDAFGADGVLAAIPLTNYDVESPAQIAKQMDGLTYSKGASVYRMLLNTLGASTFQKGLRNFLNENAYSASGSAGLSTAMQQAADEDHESLPDSLKISDLIDSWTLQPGYPVVTAIRDYITNNVTLSQERFLWFSLSPKEKETWTIPFSVSNEGSLSQVSDVVEGATPKEIALGEISSSSLYVVNWGQHGYYRVNYDLINWNRICASALLDGPQRAALIDDAFALAHTGRLEQFYSLYVMESALESLQPELAPWTAINRNLWRVRSLVRSDGESDRLFTLYVREHILEKAFDSIGWNVSAAESSDTRAVRDIITQLACQYGVAACKESAIDTYLANRNAVSQINGDILAATLCEALSFVNQETVQSLFKLYQSETDVSRRSAFVFGFGCIPDEDALNSLMDTFVKSSSAYGEVAALMRSITAHSPKGSQVVSDYVSDAILNIISTLGNDETLQILWDLGISASNENQFLKVDNSVIFFDYDSTELGNLTEVAGYNLQWVRKSLPELMDYVGMQMGVTSRDSEGPEPTPTPQPGPTPAPVPPTPTPAPGPTNPPNPVEDQWLLPGDVLPESYVLSVVPYITDEDTSTFDGTVDITLKAITATDSIVLHASESLTVSAETVTVLSNQGVAVEVDSTSRNATTEFFTVKLKTSLVEGNLYKLSLTFSGQLRKDMEGFYLSTYKVGSVTKFMATTFMAPTFARKAFPCFDEPRYRATFEITVAKLDSQIALSNMPVKSTSATDPNIGNRVRVSFETTPPMATYLVAFIVSELREVNTSNPNIHVYVREGAESEAAFAADLAPRVLSAMEEFTGYDYPLPKLDLVAVPDFLMGAMENWGLITYRENRLLLGALSSSQSQLEAATTLTHEFAHMWFGDLVTVAQWSSLWEQEGMASFLERFILDKATDKEYHAMHWLGVERVQTALAVDALQSAEPLTNLTLTSPESIFDHLGTITYSKGAGFLHMLMETYGKATFQKGLQIYLTNNAFGWATPADLAVALQQAVDAAGAAAQSSVSVQDIVDSWTLKPGYPVVTVMLDYDYGGTATVTQSRFLAQDVDEPSTDTWKVPYRYVVRDATSSTAYNGVLDDSTTTTSINTGQLTKSSVAVFNKNGAGFFRVNYDVHNWLRLAHDPSALSEPPQLAATLDDAFALTRAGLLDAWLPLVLVQTALPRQARQALKASPVVWDAARRGLFHLAALSRGDPETALIFQAYLGKVLTEEPFSLVAWRNQWNIEESFDTKCARAVLTQLACEAQNTVCSSVAQESFSSWLADPSSIGDPDVLPATLCVGLAQGGSSDFAAAWQAFQAFDVMSDRSERLAFVSGLGCTRDAASVQKLLEAGATGDYFESQEIEPLFISIIDHNEKGVEDVLTYVNDNFATILSKKGLTRAAKLVQLIAERVYSSSQYEKIRALASAHPSLELQVATRVASMSLRWATESSAEFKETMAAAVGIQLAPPPTKSPPTLPTHPPTSPNTNPTVRPVTNPTASPVTNPTRSPVTTPTRSPVTNPTGKPSTNPPQPTASAPTTPASLPGSGSSAAASFLVPLAAMLLVFLP